jgi:hypothetical protein
LCNNARVRTRAKPHRPGVEGRARPAIREETMGTPREEHENEEGHGTVSGQEPSTEELEGRFKEQHDKVDDGSSEDSPTP